MTSGCMSVPHKQHGRGRGPVSFKWVWDVPGSARSAYQISRQRVVYSRQIRYFPFDTYIQLWTRTLDCLSRLCTLDEHCPGPMTRLGTIRVIRPLATIAEGIHRTVLTPLTSCWVQFTSPMGYDRSGRADRVETTVDFGKDCSSKCSSESHTVFSLLFMAFSRLSREIAFRPSLSGCLSPVSRRSECIHR
jgi:hypothetical protein